MAHQGAGGGGLRTALLEKGSVGRPAGQNGCFYLNSVSKGPKDSGTINKLLAKWAALYSIQGLPSRLLLFTPRAWRWVVGKEI